MFKDAQVTAKALGVQFQIVEVKSQNPDFEGAFRVMVKERIGALITEAAHHQYSPKKDFGASGTKSHPSDALGIRMGERRRLISYGSNRVDYIAVWQCTWTRSSKVPGLPTSGGATNEV